MKRWWMLGLLATVFVVLGGVIMLVLGRVDPVGYVAGGIFLVVGLGMWWSALAMRRELSLAGQAVPDAAPGEVSFAEVADRVRARLAGTPYVVDASGRVIRVRADLADATFLTWAAVHRVREIRGMEVVATGPRRAVIRDTVQGYELAGGTARLRGKAHAFSGRSWSYTRRVDYGVGTDGSVGRQVDIDFASSEIQKPVIEVLKETGWYSSWFSAQSAETKGAIVVAAVAGVGAIAAVVAVIITQVL